MAKESDKKCFLCLQEIQGRNYSLEENFAILCQILEVPHLINRIPLGPDKEKIVYCFPCFDKISYIQDLMEKLESLEREVLNEKNELERKLKESLKKFGNHSNLHTENLTSSEQLRNKFVDELKSNTIKSVLSKINRKQLGRKCGINGDARIMREVAISKADMNICKNIAINSSIEQNSEHPITKGHIVDDLSSQIPSDDQLNRFPDKSMINDSSEQCWDPFQYDQDHNNEPKKRKSPTTKMSSRKTKIGNREEPGSSSLTDFLQVEFSESEEPAYCFYGNEPKLEVITSSGIADPLEGVSPHDPDFKVENDNSFRVYQYDTELAHAYDENAMIADPDPDTLFRQHDPETIEMFSCGTCGESFPSINQMNDHCLIHAYNNRTEIQTEVDGRKIFICPVCAKQYTSYKLFNKHICRHNTSTSTIVSNLESTRRSLNSFSKIDLEKRKNSRKFPCRYCEKVFIRRGHAEVHELIHTGEKPFQCRYCAHKCRTKGDIVKHERLHTGEKPYKCQYCDKCFGGRFEAKKHILQMHIKSGLMTSDVGANNDNNSVKVDSQEIIDLD